MATATIFEPEFVTLEEYLQTSYRPDCDFVDGHLEERNMGDTQHSLLQVELAFWFRSHSKEWNIRVMTALRTRVAATRVRLPDVGVAYNDAAMAENVRMTPLLIAMEVLSPDDRMPRVHIRMEDFWKMGIRHIWLFDPVERVAFTYTGQGLMLVEASRLTIPNSPIYLDLPELFSGL